MREYEPERAHREGVWTMESQDPAAPAIECRRESSDVLICECTRYRVRVEREESQRSRARMTKDGKRFADVSVHHECSESDGWAFTEEVLHIVGALVWSAARRDKFPGATFGSNAELER